MHRTRFSSIGAALLASAALAVPAVAAAPPFKATLKTPKTQPKVGKLWDITVTAKSNAGRPLRASAYYQFVFNGQVVVDPVPGTGYEGSRRPPQPVDVHGTLLRPAAVPGALGWHPADVARRRQVHRPRDGQAQSRHPCR